MKNTVIAFKFKDSVDIIKHLDIIYAAEFFVAGASKLAVSTALKNGWHKYNVLYGTKNSLSVSTEDFLEHSYSRVFYTNSLNHFLKKYAQLIQTK